MMLAMLCSCSTICIELIALINYAVALHCQADECISRLHQDTVLAEIFCSVCFDVLSVIQAFEAFQSLLCFFSC